MANERDTTAKDIAAAYRAIEEELPPDFDINFFGLPRSVGVKGDERIHGRSVVIGTWSRIMLKSEIQRRGYERIARAASRICSETDSACR